MLRLFTMGETLRSGSGFTSQDLAGFLKLFSTSIYMQAFSGKIRGWNDNTKEVRTQPGLKNMQDFFSHWYKSHNHEFSELIKYFHCKILCTEAWEMLCLVRSLSLPNHNLEQKDPQMFCDCCNLYLLARFCSWSQNYKIS